MSYNLAQIPIVGGANYTIPIIATVPAAVSWVCVLNMSPYVLNMSRGTASYIIPPGFYWPLKIDAIGLPITFNTIAPIAGASPPFSWYSATVYEYGEEPPISLQSPISFVSQVGISGGSTNVGTVAGTVAVSGTVSLAGQVVTIDNTLFNDGLTLNTFVEATVYGSSDSNVVIKNDGTWNIVEYVSSTLTPLMQITPGSGIKLGASGRLTEVLGNMKPDGTMTSTGATSFAGGGTVTGSSLSSTGVVTGSSAVITTGSITRISSGSLSLASNSATVVTHNLGTTPDIVVVEPGTSLGPNIFRFSVYSYTSTQFTIYQYDNAGSAITMNWMAIKL